MPVAFGGHHLQSLNDRVGRSRLISRLVFNLLGSLSNLQYEFVSVGKLLKKLVKDSRRAHFAASPESYEFGTFQHTRCESDSALLQLYCH